MGRYCLALLIWLCASPVWAGCLGIPDVSGIVNVKMCSGADLGAQVNAAFAAIPNGGVILIPAGVYSFTTTIQCPTTTLVPYIIQGQGRFSEINSTGSGTYLDYHGSGDAINDVITNPTYQSAPGCILRDFTLDGRNAGASAIGFHFGGTLNTTTPNVGIIKFGGAGIEIENASGMFTERYDLKGSLWRDAIGIYFHCDAGCTTSFEHGAIDEQVNTLNSQTAIKIDGTGQLSNSSIVLNGNVEGTSGGTLIEAAGSSIVNNNTYALYPECDMTTCTRFKVSAAGATIAGLVVAGMATNNSWVDSNGAGGTLLLYGYAANNTPQIFVMKESAAAPTTAIGANQCELFPVPGTGAGTCKIQAMCGTSATPVTVVDNVGSGC